MSSNDERERRDRDAAWGRTISFLPSKTSFPRSVNSILRVPISHPFALSSTVDPNARAMIWCPKQMPMSLSDGLSAGRREVNSTSAVIHGMGSYADAAAHGSASVSVCQRPFVLP